MLCQQWSTTEFFKSLALSSGLLLGHLLGRLLGKINAEKVSDSALTCENAVGYLNFYLVDYSVQHEALVSPRSRCGSTGAGLCRSFLPIREAFPR